MREGICVTIAGNEIIEDHATRSGLWQGTYLKTTKLITEKQRIKESWVEIHKKCSLQQKKSRIKGN